MTGYEAKRAVLTLLEEMRRTRFTPEQAKDTDGPRQKGFDDGYFTALIEVEMKLYRAFPDEAGR